MKKVFVFIYFLLIVGIFTASDNQIKVVEKSMPTTTEATPFQEENSETDSNSSDDIVVITADVSKLARELRSSNKEELKTKKSYTKNSTEKNNSLINGIASFYGEYFHGRQTANGEIYDMYGLTAAHKTLPLGTIVKVTNTENEKSVIVRINDRGPYIDGRDIDLSQGAFDKIGNLKQGLLSVKVEILEKVKKN